MLGMTHLLNNAKPTAAGAISRQGGEDDGPTSCNQCHAADATRQSGSRVEVHLFEANISDHFLGSL